LTDYRLLELHQYYYRPETLYRLYYQIHLAHLHCLRRQFHHCYQNRRCRQFHQCYL
jgi:hypothetical protein